MERITETHRTQISNQWELAAIQADQAYANLELAQGSDAEPGAGVTIGLIDSGIDTEHPHFSGQNNIGRILDGAVDERGDKPSHGTAVCQCDWCLNHLYILTAFLSVGALTASAWGADLKMFAIRLREEPPPVYDPISLTSSRTADSTRANLFNNVLGQDIDILNLSISLQGIIENYSEQDIRNHLSRTIATWAQTGAQEKRFWSGQLRQCKWPRLYAGV